MPGEEPRWCRGHQANRFPIEVVGTWRYNWVSGVHQQTPDGHWLPPTGANITFVFTDDGLFALADFRQASTHCTNSVHQTVSGSMAVDGERIVRYPVRGHIISRSDCRADWNYERDDPGEAGAIHWRPGQDALGNHALLLSYPRTRNVPIPTRGTLRPCTLRRSPARRWTGPPGDVGVARTASSRCRDSPPESQVISRP
jgi:hypothetical protein